MVSVSAHASAQRSCSALGVEAWAHAVCVAVDERALRGGGGAIANAVLVSMLSKCGSCRPQ